MQTKVTFYVFYRNEILTSTKYLIIDDSTKEELGDTIATFDEYSKIAVKFESDDSNAILEIDSSISEYPLQLRPSDEVITISEAEDHDSMLTPGYYGINVITTSKIYRGLYFLNSKSVIWEGLINLRKYLETIMTGLAQNLYIQRMSGQKNIYGDEDYSLNKMYFYISNNIENVINSVGSIIKNPLTDIKKRYREQYYVRKQDVKSQRWLCTKGFSKNKNIYIPDIVLEKHSFLDTDILENCYIKQMIEKILEIVLFIENRYEIIQANSIDIINNKIEIYKDNELSYNVLKNDRVVSGEHKASKKRELKFLQNDIDKLQEHTVFITDILTNLKKIKNMLLIYVNETWLNEIMYTGTVLRPSQKLLRDNRYYQIYDFYLNILTIEKNDPQNRKPYFPSKKTSKLFEYYSVCLIINILKSEGFEWQSGWLADDMDEELFNGEIPTNKPIILIKDNLRAELFYEKEVEANTTVMDKNISDFVRMNGRHYKPDIMLSLFDNETRELINSIVIEAKCCMSRNLKSKNGPSKAIEQAKDYYNFGYYDKKKRGKNKTRRGVIEAVIITYPKQDRIIHYGYDDMNVSFIQVEAADTMDITKHFGYKELKNEIDTYFL
ncbi:hypothetical protein VT91_21390 [Clostridium sporogenes]|uniref:hypothetical protein n=1 Tax=Clostridium botulinum TaxID=1491 RepID=UPI000717AEFF|nr:hypothetical protein [Clostridium botulinum]KRU28943.1 hypothetical protein VT91_21390 [Clostridium sporogenes]KRU32436.1 hypothetical protein WG71_00470 [Clostridium sporogenes]KRU34755.1 hypothetical protein VT28_02720 [Clostridium sporogenes]KRU45994.1 hypothetical protein VT95_10290 [Clostridium sporogenes]MBZ1329752.1 hypothetical protein [Clostridium botulinum]